MTDREIDALVASRVMGWSAVTNRRTADGTWTGIRRDGPAPVVDDIPLYSTSIAAANEVFHHMNGHPDYRVWERFNDALSGRLSDNPRAICLAAMKAVGVDVPE